MTSSFGTQTKEHREIPVTEQVEVVSVVGDIAIAEGRAKIHGHVVVGVPTAPLGPATSWKAPRVPRSR